MKGKEEPKHHYTSLRMRNQQKEKQTSAIDRRIIYGALAVIVLISVIAYLPVFHNNFIEWDDAGYIKNNPLIHSINLKEIFSSYILGNYHPVTMLTFAIEYNFFGLKPTGYHAVNLLLHLLNVILVFYSVFLLSDKAAVALVASLLFGIHPLHVESVAWAAELKDLLYTFFFLASYIFYLKYLKEQEKATGNRQQATERRYKFYYMALALFTLSLLSKAMAASLPLVLVLTDYFKGRKIDKKALLEKAPFFLLAFVLGVVAVLAQKSSDSIQFTSIFSFPQPLVFASYGFIAYLFKLLFPLNLSAFYPYPFNNGVIYIPIQYYVYVFFLLALGICIIYSRRFSKKIIFGMGFFTITILFVLQLLPVGRTIMADRYSYIPSIGIFYLAGEGVLLLWSKKLKLAVIILLSVSTVLFSVKTYSRCGVWKNDMTLWNNVIDYDKTIEDAYINRGIAFFSEKRNDEAIRDFNKAIELKPDYAKAFFNRGIFFMNVKRNNEAIRDFDMAIGLNPKYARAYYNRGLAKLLSGKKYNACMDLKKAARLGYSSVNDPLYQMCK